MKYLFNVLNDLINYGWQFCSKRGQDAKRIVPIKLLAPRDWLLSAGNANLNGQARTKDQHEQFPEILQNFIKFFNVHPFQNLF